MSKDISELFTRVADWNSKRYAREYNHHLGMSLLTEEMEEYIDAETEVDQLDALGDIVYVAMGILWKLNIPAQDLNTTAEEASNTVIALFEANAIDPIYLASGVLLQMTLDNEFPTSFGAQLLVILCLTQMTGFGLSHEEVLDAMYIICDSNDSKSIKKVASDVKANDGDKGAFFVDPAPRLQALLDRARGRQREH